MFKNEPKAIGLRMSAPAFFEPLEVRVLFANPTVNTVNPADGATNVARDIFIACDLNLLANSGTSEVDPDTLVGNVTLTKTSNSANVVGTIKTSGGGDSIVFSPSGILVANAQYTFKVTAGVKDLAGNPFVAFTSTFTTGTKTNAVPSNIRFDQIPLPNATGHQYTAVVKGPDGMLYASDDQGYIYRYVINPDGTLGASKTIKSVRDNNIDGSQTETAHGARIVAGMAFDPTASPKHPVLWIASGYPSVQGSPNWSGKISKLSGTNLSVYQDIVTNLPRSFKDHLTEGISFGPDGKIYVSQASNSAMGAPDTTWANRPEQLLNAAILRLDVSKLGSLPLNAKTAEGGTYDPFAANAPLTIYADGIRNAYQPVWTSDGHLFAAANGSSSGGNSPAGPGVPAETNLPTQPDFLFDVKAGKYYGHPNPLRNQYVENGGNPTSGVDKAEVVAYPVGTQPDANYGGFAFNFGSHQSPNGAIEYKSNTFGGVLKGDLLVAQYAGGSNIVDLSRSGGTITDSQQSIAGFTGFNEPLGIAEDTANGNLYVANYGGKSIMLLRVNDKPLAQTPEIAASKTELLFTSPKGTSSSRVTDTFVNGGLQELDISSISITGTNAADFTISTKPTLPASLQPGQSTSVSVKFSPSGSAAVGLHTASLTIKSNDPGHPTFNVQLRGIVTASAAASDEPSLQALLNLYQIPITVGDNDSASATLPLPVTKPNSEISAQLFTRADASTPVTVVMLGSYDTNSTPVNTVGYYSSLDGTLGPLFDINNGQNATVNPLINGFTSFFPGKNPFGVYVESDQHSHTVYSENSRNTFDNGNPTAGHLVRVYPLKDTDGSTVANAYLVAFETLSGSTIDNQDVVFEIHNVKPSAVSVAGPPAAPKNLAVLGTTGSISLDWSDNTESDLAGYVVKRSTNSKTNFIEVSTGLVSDSEFVDTGAGPKKYYYRVFAQDTDGNISDPAKIAATRSVSSTPPAPTIALASSDIGSPTPKGSTNALVSGNAYDMIAGGTDIQGTSDQFRYAYTQMTGNFDIKVRIDSMTTTAEWTKAGIMVRKSLDANARNIFVLSSPTKYRVTYRVNPGDVTIAVGAGTPVFPNNWLRMARVGNTYTGYSSTDGKHWTVISSVTMNLGNTLYVGLAATSHNPSKATTVQFRNLA